MKQDIVIVAALGAIAAYAVHCVRHARQVAMQPKAKPVELQRWEDEGGGVPLSSTAAAGATPEAGGART